MASIAMNTAATGLGAMKTQMDVIANNLANSQTTGFKSSRVNFEDLLYQHKEQPGVENANGDKRPAGLQVGLGVRVSNTDYSFEQGAPLKTDGPLDLMIKGNGFFQVDILDSQGSGTGYTRAGNFLVNPEGDVVLGNTDGPRLIPNMTVDDNIISIEVTQDGQVWGEVSGQTDKTKIGDLELVSFINPKGLKSIGGNIYIETDGSGTPDKGQPGDDGLGTILQGFLEASNVDPVKELVALVEAQRAFELNSKVIKAGEETLQIINNMTRL